MLLNKRLDLDIANTRLKKAHEADREARVRNKHRNMHTFLSTYQYFAIHLSYPAQLKKHTEIFFNGPS